MLPKMALKRLVAGSPSVPSLRRALAQSPPRKSHALYMCLLGIGAGAVLGAGYSYRQFADMQTPTPVTQQEVRLLDEAPAVRVSHTVVHPGYRHDLRLQLFQYSHCPLCGKLRAFLDYYGLTYDVVEVNPTTKWGIRWSPRKQIPIVVAQEKGQTTAPIYDSEMIISVLLSYFTNKGSRLEDVLKTYPTFTFLERGVLKTEVLNKYFLLSKKKQDEQRVLFEGRWRRWVDEALVPALIPNIYRTPHEAVQSLRWFAQRHQWHKSFSHWETLLIIYTHALPMWLQGQALKREHKLKEDVRESLYEVCDEWMKGIEEQGRGAQFMGGDGPNLADIEVYGVLNSLEGCATFQDIMKSKKLEKWFWAVHMHVKKSKGRAQLQR